MLHAKDDDMVKHRRRIGLSTFRWPFRHGDLGAVGRSRMPMARSRWLNICQGADLLIVKWDFRTIGIVGYSRPPTAILS